MWLKYSDAPILNGEYCDRAQRRPGADGYISEYEKPIGCWITDDTEDCWRSWCLSERFNLECLTHKHEIVLDEDNILILRSLYELDLFAREFSRSERWGPPDDPRKWTNVYIDWPKVSSRYKGLIITPYQWHRRMHTGFSWYYGWDCASGCIWAAGAIREIRLIEIDYAIAEKRKAEAA